MGAGTAVVIWWLVGFACGVVAMCGAYLIITHRSEYQPMGTCGDSPRPEVTRPIDLETLRKPKHPKPAPPPPQHRA